MAVASTAGIRLRRGSRAVRGAVELLSSMRFSISLLAAICIASVIGTVVQQNKPLGNYVNQFGPFWTEVFTSAGLTRVYSASWYLLMLGFLVVSTSLCIARNTPKILADLRRFKEDLRVQSLEAFHHRGDATLAETPGQAFARVASLLSGRGWRAKVQERREADGRVIGTMIAARKGRANKLGYVAAHSAIVLICLGGLLDGDLAVRLEMALQGKRTYTGVGFVKDIPAQHRLSPGTLTFRGSLEVPEGGRRGTALIGQQDGVVLQDLPFEVELKKFIVEYYESGMPKLFASEIVIHDRETGQASAATVKVNEPAFHRGIAIYQSSLEDGGSRLKLKGVPLSPGPQPAFDLQGVVGTQAPLPAGAGPYTVEFTGLRAINVENFGDEGAQKGSTDVRKVDLVSSLQAQLGSGVKTRTTKTLRNVGASFSYKLRDAAGQAREYNNYMVPVEMDGQRMLWLGVRDAPSDPFRYLRVPVDGQDSIDTWLRLRHALLTPALRKEAVDRFVAASLPAGRQASAADLRFAANETLDLFSGAVATPDGTPPLNGLAALSRQTEARANGQQEREAYAALQVRLLSGSLFQLFQLSEARAGQPAPQGDAATQRFLTQSVMALSDSFAYPAPVLLQLEDFQQVQASVFQVTRAPGKMLVYLGFACLIGGVFGMLYVRERRLWVWLQPVEGGGVRIRTALSTPRRTLDADAEFEALKQALLKEQAAP